MEQAATFLSGLTATLKSEEATRDLVDSIVTKDPDTGETRLTIPVPDKQTVSDVLSLIGKLFGHS